MNDGLNQRFIYCYGESIYEPVSECSEICEFLKDDLKVCFDDLLELRKNPTAIIELSEEAKAYFVDIENRINKKVYSQDFNSDLEAFYIKMISYVGRLALVLHLVKRASVETKSEIIELSTMQQAESIAEYFLKQAEKAFKMISETPEVKTITKIVNWIKRKELISVKPRDVQMAKVLGDKIKTSEIRSKLALLQDYGHGYWNKEKDLFIFFVN